MTDEETDDDNDRMERANRIREMREGRRRGGPDDEDDADDAESTDDASGSETGDDSASEPVAADSDESVTGDDEVEAGGTSTDDRQTESAGADDEPAAGSDSETTDNAVEESGFEFEDDATQAGDASDDHDRKTEAHDEKAQKDVTGDTVAQTTPQSGATTEVSSGGAAEAVANLQSDTTFTIPDQATTVTEKDQETMLEGAEQSVAAARAAASGTGTAHVGARTRVLEFILGTERFCLDIDYIEEIVELENMTRVPNSPSYVEGVVDLRGQVTTIINPKDALEVDTEGQGELIIVFDSAELDDQGGHLGWVVDEVRQVTPVSDDEVNDSPDEEAEYINGIINRDDEDDFIVWTTPELALNSS